MTTKNTPPLPKTSRTSSKCQYDIAFSTWRCRPLLGAETHSIINDRLALLEVREGLSMLYRAITPSSVAIRLQAPPNIAPSIIVSRIKAELHRAIIAAYPGLQSRTPSIWTRASYIQTIGHGSPEASSRFLDRERGAHAPN